MKIDVATHISVLLYENNRVIVPTLGAFCATYKQANTEKYGHIAPPTKELFFDESLNFHDNVLIEHLVQSYKIPYSEALVYVETFVADIKNKIKSNPVVIANIGRLYLDTRNDMVLLPGSVNFLEDSFGLPKMVYHPISRQKEKAAILATVKGPEQEKESQLKQKILAIWNDPSTRAVLVIILLVVIVLPQLSRLSNKDTEIVSPTIIENEMDLVDKNKTFKPFDETSKEGTEVVLRQPAKREKAAIIPVETPTPKKTIPKETPKKEVIEPITPPKKEVVKSITTTPVTTKVETPKTNVSALRKDYVVVIGNFSTEANANIATKEVKTAGYVAYTKKISATKYRVGISMNCKVTDLDTQLVKIKTAFPGAWVMNR